MTQQAEVGGEHNTVVQINGNGNHVVLGGRRLSLTLPGGVARSEAQSDTLSKFYPGSQSTTFIGREREWKMLDAFLDAEAPLSFLVLTGDGGSGKTRLALELCLARRKLGWEAGFISSRELACADAGTGWHGDRDTLIVVDYAGSRAQQLRDVLRALSNQPGSGRRLRFLLLERTAKDDAGWLSMLLGDGGERSHAVRRLQYGNSPYALSPLTGRETLLALARDFLTKHDRPNDVGQWDEDLVRRLDAAWGGNPLYLMLAAYTMLYRGDRTTTWTREKLAEEFAGKEMERIRGQASARGLDGGFLVELAACVTLAQGVTKEEFGVWAKKIHADEGMSGRWRSYVDALPEVLPHQPGAEEDRLPPLRPDIIGEAFVLRALQHRTELLLDCLKEFGPAALDTLLRLGHDFGNAHTKPRQWLEAVLETCDTPESVADLYARMPSPSLSLRDLALKVTEKWLASAAAGQTSRATYAAMQGNHALALHNMGRHQEALEAAQEAVKLFRELAVNNPDVFRPLFATSLSNLANGLSDVGQLQKALEAAREAVDIRRKLFADDPDAFRPALGSTLNNLANRLNSLGQHQEALAASREAVTIYRELDAKSPAAFRPDLALSLNNLANVLNEVGQPRETLEATQEAVTIYRELDAENPAAFRPELAGTLNNLACLLNDVGQHQEALKAAQEAISMYRELAANLPTAFRPNLAMSLYNLASVLANLERHQEALKAAQEAVDIRQELCANDSDAFRPALASSLTTLANILSTLGRHREALEAAQQAVYIFRTLDCEGVFVPQSRFAVILRTLSRCLRAVDQDDSDIARELRSLEDVRKKNRIS